jgi:spore germination protein KB
MNKEVISDKQGLSLLIIFIVGTSTMVVAGSEAKKDFWLAIILAMCMAFPILLIYARLCNIFPHKDLFDIIELCFGKVLGKGLCLFYTWHLFHGVTMVLLNFGLFVNTIAFSDTPRIIPMIGISILSIWALKEGIEVMGRWTEFFIIIFAVSILVVFLLLIPNMTITNILPFLSNGMQPVIKGAFSSFSFPFGETVLFNMIFFNLKSDRSSYKIYMGALLIGGGVLLLVSLMDIFVLGENTVSNTYFPSYDALTRINIGDLLQRLEIIIGSIYTFGAFMKMSLYLYAACRCVTKVFGYNHYRFAVTPISLLMINLSYFLHDNIIYNMEWNLEIWAYYAFPFQVIFPILIWITAEIKKRQYTIKNRIFH